MIFAIGHSFANELVSYTNPRSYHVRHSGCSYNINITTMTSLEINIPLTENWVDCEVSNLKVTGDDVIVLSNTEGPGQVARIFFKDGHPVKGRTVSVVLEYDVELYQVNIDYDKLVKQTYPEYQRNKEYEYYTSLGGLNLDHPEFCSVVETIKAKSRGNPVRYAKEAFDWVGSNLKYGPCPPDAKGDTVTFDHKCGDCGAYGSIFVALCRGGGVPARFVAGCWAGGFNGWHCWGEFMLPDGTWIPADHSPAGRFGFITNNHLPLAKTGGMTFDTDLGTKKCGFIQPGYWFYWFGGGGEGGDIATEFAVESFAYSDMPAGNDAWQIGKARNKAQKSFKQKKYDESIRIWQYLLLSELISEKDKRLIHYQLAKCYLKKDWRVKAALELLPLINCSDENISERALSFLKNVRSKD